MIDRKIQKSRSNLIIQTAYSVNIMVGIIFMLLNPLYALVITTLIGLFTNKVNSLFIGILYILSFSLMFSNQEFELASDLGGYINMYRGTEGGNFSSFLENYLLHMNGHEILWLYYSKVIGLMSGYNKEIFVFATYLLIFSLSAYLAFLVSEYWRFNFVLLLFCLIFFELSFMYAGYNLWRNIIAVLIFLIGAIKYSSGEVYIYF